MKKLFLVSSIGIFSALVLGSAAALDVDGGTVQAGEDITLQCDTDGVDISYTVAWNTTTEQHEVTEVVVDNIDVACAGSTLTVDLTDGGGASISDGSDAIVLTTETVDVDDVEAAIVGDVHVAIH